MVFQNGFPQNPISPETVVKLYYFQMTGAIRNKHHTEAIVGTIVLGKVQKQNTDEKPTEFPVVDF